MAEPFEILATPFEVWLAPVGEDFPAVTATPSGEWELLGANGADNQGDEGVTVEHQQTIVIFRGGKSTAPLKAWRTEEGLKIAFTLHDLTAETYSKALNNATIEADIADDDVGTRSILLHQGGQVEVFALLARGENSPYGDDMNAQYEVPKVYQAGNPSPVFAKGKPAGLAFEFMALADLDAASEDERFGRLLFQDDDSS